MAASREPSLADESDPRLRKVGRWLLLDGHRSIVAGLVVLVLFGLGLVATTSGIGPLRDLQPIFYLYSALIGGNITLVTVIVGINQLILSRELNRPGELESQIEGIVDYRREVKAEAGQVPPAEPRQFLTFLVATIRDRAEQVQERARTDIDGEIADDLDEIVVDVLDHLDKVDELLERTGTSPFRVLSTTLTTDYAKVITALRRIESNSDTLLRASDTEAIDELIDRLEEFNVAQHYFKTIYLQQELAALTRRLFYVGFPAIVVLAGGLLLLTASDGAAVSRGLLRVILPATVAIGLVPLAVLFAIMLRIGTVTERTAATAPFTTPTQES